MNIPQRHRALDNLTLSLPAGLLANIDGLPRCSIAAANAGTCAVNTKIGSVVAKAGQGTNPGTFNGDLYLTDAPSAGDIVGIAVDLPAVVGPVDLGVVTTIADVKLRPSDYGIDVIAAVPTSVQGIPLHLQQLKLTVDKANFLTNPPPAARPTPSRRCMARAAATSRATRRSGDGCAALGFNPSVSFSASPAQAAGAAAFYDDDHGAGWHRCRADGCAEEGRRRSPDRRVALAVDQLRRQPRRLHLGPVLAQRLLRPDLPRGEHRR